MLVYTKVGLINYDRLYHLTYQLTPKGQLCEVILLAKKDSTRYDGKKTNKSSEVENYREVQTWLRTVSEKSRPLYLSALRKFCVFSRKKPDELIEQRDKELKSNDHNSRTGIRDLILDFRTYLEKEGYAPKTINANDGAIRGFFTAVLGKGAMINIKNYRNAQVRQKKDLVPTLEEMRTILDVSTLEEKFRILFLAQTGMRISDALAM